jgi:hypothetical protein
MVAIRTHKGIIDVFARQSSGPSFPAILGEPSQRVQDMVWVAIGNIFLVPLGCSGGIAAWTV